MNCIFAALIEYRNISIQKKLSACAKTLILYYPHAYPPPILRHPMHALPLFYPTSCIPSPLFYPSPCIPSPYSIPAHAYAPPTLSHPMHTLPVFYPSSCTPSPYSMPAYTHPTLFYSTPCMPSLYSIPPIHALLYSIPPYVCPLLFSTSHTCIPSILFHLMHALLTPCYMNLEGKFLLWHLRMPLLNLFTLSISSSFT